MTFAPVTIHAEWDEEAGVWSITSDDVPGLNIEAFCFGEIESKVSAALADLAGADPTLATLAGRPLVIRTN